MLDERRIQQLAQAGWIPKADHGKYNLVDSVQGYVKYLKEHTRDQSRGTEHAKLARAQTVKVEMENFRRMGELQVTSQVEETMQGLIIMMKSSHEGLPGRLASELAGTNEAPLVYRRLQTELRVILDQCADFLEKRADSLDSMPEPGTHVEALEAPDTDPMGAGQPGDAGGQP